MSKTLQDRAISSEFFDLQVSTRVSYAKGKIFNFCHFWWPSWILVENEKSVNISKIIRDRAISSEFLIRGIVQVYPMERGKFQFSPLLAAILDFSGK